MDLNRSAVPGREAVPLLRARVAVALLLTTIAFVVVIWRLYSLQIVRGEELSRRSQQNFARKVEVLHDRGIDYDRQGRILVDNRPSIDLEVIPKFIGKREQAEKTMGRLAHHLSLAPETVRRITDTVLARRGGDAFVPVSIKRDLDPAQVEAIEADRSRCANDSCTPTPSGSIFLLGGVNIVEGRRRTYRHGTLAAHLLGYVNEIDPGRLDAEKRKGNPLRYQRENLLGRSGVEHHFESQLRGSDGYEKVVVDTFGRRLHGSYVESLLGAERRVPPTPGYNVFLTIDLELQRVAEESFNGRAGSLVAVDPNNGDVLAMVSVPAFDPNVVSGLLGPEAKARLDTDPLKPWVNRSIQGQYAPGSTFKVVTALAALLHNQATPADKVFCPGYYRMGRHVWRCHKDSGHGHVNLRDALKVSCDTYFYTMAGRLGIDRIAEAGHLLGLGVKSGISLRGEKPALMPDRAFHDRVERSTGGYQPGMAVNTSIGQGSVLMTPLQLAMAYAAIANNGTLYTPQIVHRVETADFRVVRRYLPESYVSDEVLQETTGKGPTVVETFPAKVRSALPVSPDYLHAVQVGLIAVASEPGGTAYYRRSRKVPMAGKTGTAQVVRLGKDREKAEDMLYEERDHAWFVGYAPAEKPEIVVVVVNEHSGHGSSKAAPIAVPVIDAFFDLQKRRAEKERAVTGDRPRIWELHWPLIAVVLTVVGLGIYNLHSAAAARDPTLYQTQLYWFLFGLVLAVGVVAVDYRMTAAIAYVAYAVVCLLLLAVLVQGKTAGGAQRWLVLGPLNFQPSELAKLAVVLCLARYFSSRVRETGYSLRELFRPLNVSRPFAVLAFLAFNWTKPWLVDPVGELARFIAGQPAPIPANLLWFRFLLIVCLVAGCAAGILVLMHLAKQQELLDPWPPKRLQRLIGLTVVVFLSFGGVLAFYWQHPMLCDPFGVVLASLHRGAAPGGPYAELSGGVTLRLFLLVGATAYSIASVVALRRGATHPVDLVIAPIDLLALPALLVLVEPDLGTAGIVVLIGFTMILIVGVKARSLVLLCLLGAMVAGVAWFGVLKDYQKRRIVTFIDPEGDIKGAGWNAVQSLIAVGSGRWWGKGHQEGTQSQLSFLPEQHTDFAFSVWAEEQGFVGCLVVLLLYLILLVLAFSIAMMAHDTYGSLLAVGVAGIILWQTLINVAMVIGMMPVVGLTLPMFSYGGSSMLTVMLGVGLLLNVHWRRLG